MLKFWRMRGRENGVIHDCGNLHPNVVDFLSNHPVCFIGLEFLVQVL